MENNKTKCPYCNEFKHVGSCDFFNELIPYDKEKDMNPQYVTCIRRLGQQYSLHVEQTYLQDGELYSGDSLNVEIKYCPRCGKELL